MNANKIISIIVILLFLTILVPTSISEDETPWWDNNWPYRQEICVPINTSEDYAKYQPIDILINFENSCWAKSSTEHSIRVVLHESSIVKELESQIYDLNSTKEDYISSCGLVFLIPEEADGKEKYYVYYSDEAKNAPDYEDHVGIGESYYSYEPVPGLFFESLYYKITEGENVVYAVTLEGEALGEKISQQVSKLKKGTKDVMPNQGEKLASFGFIYWWYDGNEWLSHSSADRLISKQVLVDGNLMVKFGIVSESDQGTLRSKGIYKYYFSPVDDKGIYVDMKHEVIDYPLPSGEEIDVGYAILHSGGIKSSTIKDFTFGFIPPYLHFYSDEERVVTHEVDQYPEDPNWKKVIGETDDYDLGSSPWLSVDYGESGRADGIIFDSNSVLTSGTDEFDGIELQLYESNYIRLPGLDGRFSYVYIMRNQYEEGEPADTVIPSDYVIEYNAKFFTTENGGYKRVENEANMYHALICEQPDDEDVIEGDGNGEKYDLTVFTRLPQSLLLKLAGPTVFLKNPYVSVELFQDDNFISYCRSGRIVFTDDYKIDWQNLTLFRKARFTDIPAGKYLVKVYLENLLLKERAFIGYQVVDLQENKTIRISCKPEGMTSLTFTDQNDNGIKDVKASLIKENLTISEASSDKNGLLQLSAPSGYNENYVLRSTYKGFLISEEDIKLGLLNRIIPLKKNYSFDIYDLTLNIKDSHGKTPDFDIDISITSDEMQYPVILTPDDVTDGVYRFKKLYPSKYALSLKYGSVKIKEIISLDKTIVKDINLHDFTLFVKDKWNLTSDVSLETYLICNDPMGSFVLSGNRISNSTYSFSDLYPGDYIVRISYKTITTEKDIKIPNGDNGHTTIVFPVVFNLTTFVYDSHGNSLGDARVVVSRNGKEIDESTNESGVAIFSVPPAKYNISIYYNDELVAERSIEVLNEKTFSILTTKEPLLPIILLVAGLILLVGFAFLSYKKKSISLFIKILVIVIALLAVVSPWWEINGLSSKPHIHTSTKMYLTPSEMTTIISNNNTMAGELNTLDEQFVYAIDIVTLLVFLGVLSIIISIVLEWFNKGRFSLVSQITGIIFFIVTIVVFTYAMSEFANIIVGSLFGSGYLDVLIPGESAYVLVNSNWGLSIGLYLLLISTVLLALATLFYKKIRKI